jgi:CRISPR/Cas system Type II protein with McrA/HNH and RuvC-like nuclease domain
MFRLRQFNRFGCHQGQLEVDHIEPLAEGGADSENNFALVHSHCNRQKGASDLRVAAEWRNLNVCKRRQEELANVERNLGRVLARSGGAKFNLRLNEQRDHVRFAFSELDDVSVRSSELYRDELSGMQYFFCIAADGVCRSR